MSQLPPPPQYSPDGRWWWDGTRWIPVVPPPGSSQPPGPPYGWNPRPEPHHWSHRPVGSTGLTLGVLAAIAAVVIAYLVVHAWYYRNCLLQPGIFDWPNSCI